MTYEYHYPCEYATYPVFVSYYVSLSLTHTHTHTQEIIQFLQNLPTSNWKNDDIELLLAEAFKLKFMFADAPGHLTVVRTS